MFGFEDFYKEIPLCEFCGVGLDVGERHLNECPVNYIEPDNMQSVLAAQYDLSQYIDEPDTLAFNLGLQLLMASDAIIQAQKQWAAKSLMDKFSELKLDISSMHLLLNICKKLFLFSKDFL